MPPDPRDTTLRKRMGLTSGGGATRMTTIGKYAEDRTSAEDVVPYAGLPMNHVEEVVLGVAATRFHSLLHGSVLGVPIDGTATGADDRPSPDALRGGALGLDIDDVAAALAAPGLGLGDEQRQLGERLMAAFTSGRLATLGAPDGLADLEEAEHGDAFWSLAGPALPTSHDDVVRAEDSAPFGPTRVGRKGRSALAASSIAEVSIKFTEGVSFTAHAMPSTPTRPLHRRAAFAQEKRKRTTAPKPSAASANPSAGPTGSHGAQAAAASLPPGTPRRRHARRPPAQPASRRRPVRGRRAARAATRRGDPRPRRSRRRPHRGADARQRGDPARGDAGRARGHAARRLPPCWLAAAAATPGRSIDALHARIVAEHVRVHGTTATYDGTGVGALREIADRSGGQATRAAWQKARESDHVVATRRGSRARRPTAAAAARPRARSPSPRGASRGCRCSWSGRCASTGRPASPAGRWTAPTSTGAPAGSPISDDHRRSLPAAPRCRRGPDQRHPRLARRPSSSATSPTRRPRSSTTTTRPRSPRWPTPSRQLDLASASLDGLREQLLGIRYYGLVVRDPTPRCPWPTTCRSRCSAARATVTRLRAGRCVRSHAGPCRSTALVDDRAPSTPGQPAQVRLRPRIQNAARWLFRLVDPAHPPTADPATALEAWVDQIHPEVAVNPICGFLLPDHIDEALEVFDRAGDPLGQLMHDTVTDAVMWEPAPGRPVPPDAGPIDGTCRRTRSTSACSPPGSSAPTSTARHRWRRPPTSQCADRAAARRRLDALVGRHLSPRSAARPWPGSSAGRSPSCARRCGSTLPTMSPRSTITADGGAEARQRGVRVARRPPVPGAHRRARPRATTPCSGFFVDDDYTRFHVVDKVVASLAPDTGRHRGQLGLLGEASTTQVPRSSTIRTSTSRTPSSSGPARRCG